MRFVSVVVGFVLLLVGCSTDPTISPTTTTSSGPPKVTVGLTYIPNIQFSPFYVAQTNKLLPDGVTLRHHGTSEGLFTALAAGTEQFVVAGGDELVQATGPDLDLVAVATYYRQYPVRIIVPKDSPITSITDLAGKRVGIPGKYGETWFGLLIAFGNAGLTENDVTVEEIGYTQQAALTTNKVDAVVGFVNSDAVALNAGGLEVRSIPIAESVPLVSICLITTRAFAAENPDMVKAVVAGTVGGIKAVVNDPDEAMTISEKYVPYTDEESKKAARSVLDATVGLFTDSSGAVSGQLDVAQWESMVGAMSAVGLVKAPLPVASTLATNDYQ